MRLTRVNAESMLADAGNLNPGPWIAHSRLAAHAAERIAQAAGLADPEDAFILGLLHDIGRQNGPRS